MSEGQTKTASLVEQASNIGSGFIISYFVWLLVVTPLMEDGILTIDDAAIITLIFTFFSFIRSYFFRRVFNWLQVKQRRTTPRKKLIKEIEANMKAWRNN